MATATKAGSRADPAGLHAAAVIVVTANRLVDQLDDFIANHGSGCKCDLCRWVVSHDDFAGFWETVRAMRFNTRVGAGFLDSSLPPL